MKKNILDYIQTFGIHTFDEEPFNEVDGLILCQLMYLKYEELEIDIDTKFETIQKLNTFEEIVWSIPRRAKENKQLIELLTNSIRFGNIELGYFRSILDEDNDEQFAAITYKLKDDLYYIAYRGTDSTLVGWKEDFNLSFSDKISAQQSAANYCSYITNTLDGRFLLGGHSKGGNLALYAYHHNDDAKIIRVDNYEGPGSIQEEFHHHKDIVIKYVTKSSIIGVLMEPTEDYFVVDSTSFGVEQHDPYSWIVEDNHFKLVDNRDLLSDYIKNTIDSWLVNMDNLEEREVFVNTLYDIINETNASNTYEMKTELIPSLKNMYLKFQSYDEETKNLLFDTLKSLMDAGTVEMRNSISSSIKNILNK